MRSVLQLQALDQNNEYSTRASISPIGPVSPTSIAGCLTPLPSSSTSIAVCNN